MKIFGMVVLIIAVVAVVPLLVIWSLNELFGFGIAYTFTTWAAVVLLQGWVQAMISVGARR